jgi:hypothetical protein
MLSHHIDRPSNLQRLADALGLVAYEAEGLAATIWEDHPIEDRPWALASRAKYSPEQAASSAIDLVNRFVRLERALFTRASDGISTSIRAQFEQIPEESRAGQRYEAWRDHRREQLPVHWLSGGLGVSQEAVRALETVLAAHNNLLGRYRLTERVVEMADLKSCGWVWPDPPPVPAEWVRWLRLGARKLRRLERELRRLLTPRRRTGSSAGPDAVRVANHEELAESIVARLPPVHVVLTPAPVLPTTEQSSTHEVLTEITPEEETTASTEARDSATESDPNIVATPPVGVPPELCSSSDIAALLKQPPDRVDTFLRRYREKHPDCFVPVRSPRRNEPRFLYRTAEVWPALERQLPRWRTLGSGDTPMSDK